MKNNFYIYVYLDIRKPGKYIYGKYNFNYEPFYVGKGNNYRCFAHLSEAYNFRDFNKHKCNIIRKIKKETKTDPKIIKLFKNLNSNIAKKLEMKVISTIGRHDLKTGPLTNQTDGGDGATGHTTSEHTRKLLRISKIGNKNPAKRKEVRKKLSYAAKNRKYTKEWIENIRKSTSGSKNPRFKWIYVLSKNKKTFETTEIRKFCQDHDIVYNSIRKNEKYKNGFMIYKDWKIERKEVKCQKKIKK
jgi:hypothetical protein